METETSVERTTGDVDRTLTLLGWGVGLWAVAAVAVRLAGQYVLVPDPIVLGVLYAVTPPAMAAVALGLYRLYGVAPGERARAALLLVTSVAVLDACALLLYPTVFPNLTPGTARLFAIWVLVAYVGVFATALRR